MSPCKKAIGAAKQQSGGHQKISNFLHASHRETNTKLGLRSLNAINLSKLLIEVKVEVDLPNVNEIGGSRNGKTLLVEYKLVVARRSCWLSEVIEIVCKKIRVLFPKDKNFIVLTSNVADMQTIISNQY